MNIIIQLLSIIVVTVTFTYGAEYKKRSDCRFPFNYNGVSYDDCITDDAASPWCSPTPTYDGLFYYCNNNEGDSLEKNSAFLEVQKKLNANQKLLQKSTSFSGSDVCTDCGLELKVLSTSLKQLEKISDDNDRNLNFLLDKENSEFKDILENNYKDIQEFLKCPSGWYRLNNDECYTILRSKTFAQAKLICQQHNAKLASINNKNENDVIVRKARALLGSRSAVMLGINDIRKEKTWVWDDKSESTFTNWNRGEPNNLGNEDCTMVYLSSGKWNDIRCSVRSNPVCRGQVIYVK